MLVDPFDVYNIEIPVFIHVDVLPDVFIGLLKAPTSSSITWRFYSAHPCYTAYGVSASGLVNFAMEHCMFLSKWVWFMFLWSYVL